MQLLNGRIENVRLLPLEEEISKECELKDFSESVCKSKKMRTTQLILIKLRNSPSTSPKSDGKQ